MKFSRKIKALAIGLAAGAFAFVLTTQDCDSRLSVFEIGPMSDLPELQVPRVLTPPYLVPPREAPLDDSPDRVAIKAELPKLHYIVPSAAVEFGKSPYFDYRVPLYWRLGNPSTAPPPPISFKHMEQSINDAPHSLFRGRNGKVSKRKTTDRGGLYRARFAFSRV